MSDGGAARLERQTRNTFGVQNRPAEEFFLRFCFVGQDFSNNVARLERQTRSASVNSGGTLCAREEADLPQRARRPRSGGQSQTTGNSAPKCPEMSHLAG